jgi:hypothetical protein
VKPALTQSATASIIVPRKATYGDAKVRKDESANQSMAILLLALLGWSCEAGDGGPDEKWLAKDERRQSKAWKNRRKERRRVCSEGGTN